MEVRTSVNPVFSTDLIRAILGSFTAAPGAELFDTPTVHLIKSNSFSIGANTAQTDFDTNEADFTDYAAKALTLTLPVNDGPEDEAAIGTVSFVISEAGAVTGNTVYGYWVEVAGAWLVGEMFEEGQEVPMSADADALVLNLVIPIVAKPHGT